MKRFLNSCVLCLAAAVLVVSCDAGGRMSNQESVQTYEELASGPAEGAVPVGGGEARFRNAARGSLLNPLEAGDEAIAAGRVCYTRYCIQCHGEALDGEGTVGQSFHPLPADLRSPEVRSLSDDRLFRIISYGSGRCPALHATIEPVDRWRLVSFIRSLNEK